MPDTTTIVGLWRTADHWYSWAGGPKRRGVTSIIDVVPKYLVPWAKRITADVAIEQVDRLREMIAIDGPTVAHAWLVAHADQKRDDAAGFGTSIHAITEAIDRGEEPIVDGASQPYVDAYRRFLADYEPEFLSRERYVFNEAVGYGGTYDFICRMADRGTGPLVVTLGDIKTGAGVYDTARLQLEGLARAEFIGLPNDPRQYRMPKIKQRVILHVRPDIYERGYRLIRFEPTEADWRAFLACVEIRRWLDSKPATGTALEPKEIAA